MEDPKTKLRIKEGCINFHFKEIEGKPGIEGVAFAHVDDNYNLVLEPTGQKLEVVTAIHQADYTPEKESQLKADLVSQIMKALEEKKKALVVAPLTNGGKPHKCGEIAVHDNKLTDSVTLCGNCQMPVDFVPETPIVPKKVGRPTNYTKELAQEFCMRIAEGNSVRSVSKDEDMPATATIFRWLRDIKEFREQYEYAIEERTHSMGEEILDIADDGTNDFMTITKGDTEYNVEDREVTNRSKLRVETRKWIMSKMKPKKYGDKIDMTTNGKDLPTPILSVLTNEKKPEA